VLLQNRTSDIKTEEDMNQPFYETHVKLRPDFGTYATRYLITLLHNSILYFYTLQQYDGIQHFKDTLLPPVDILWFMFTVSATVH
jgi:hypothetical protein